MSEIFFALHDALQRQHALVQELAAFTHAGQPWPRDLIAKVVVLREEITLKAAVFRDTRPEGLRIEADEHWRTAL